MCKTIGSLARSSDIFVKNTLLVVGALFPIGQSDRQILPTLPFVNCAGQSSLRSIWLARHECASETGLILILDRSIFVGTHIRLVFRHFNFRGSGRGRPGRDLYRPPTSGRFYASHNEGTRVMKAAAVLECHEAGLLTVKRSIPLTLPLTVGGRVSESRRSRDPQSAPTRRKDRTMADLRWLGGMVKRVRRDDRCPQFSLSYRFAERIGRALGRLGHERSSFDYSVVHPGLQRSPVSCGTV
jgi:hypothetical protein